MNPTTPSTKTPNYLRLNESRNNCWIFAASHFVCWLVLPEKLCWSAVYLSSPLLAMLPLQFLFSKTKIPLGPKTMCSMTPPPSCKYKSFKRQQSSLNGRVRSLMSKNQESKIKGKSQKKRLTYFLSVRYSCIALAARLPAPMALMTVAAPVATSPPAYTPSKLVFPTSLTHMVPCLASLCKPPVVR